MYCINYIVLFLAKKLVKTQNADCILSLYHINLKNKSFLCF